MFIPEHKPVLMLAATSVGTAVLHMVSPEVAPTFTPLIDPFDYAEKWVHLIGGIVGILAGLASVSWYVFSYLKSKRLEKP